MKNFTKYLLLLGIISLFGYNASAQTQGTKSKKTASKIGTPEYLLVKRGFKIFKLGTPIEQYKKYVMLVNEDKDNKLYKLSKGASPQVASIGDSIEINDILFNIYDGLIVSISVFVEPKYKEALLRSLQAAYGPGKKPNQYIEKYFWHASNKKADISLSYIDSYEGGGHIHGNGWAMFQDNNLIDKQDQDEKNRAKETVKDL